MARPFKGSYGARGDHRARAAGSSLRCIWLHGIDVVKRANLPRPPYRVMGKPARGNERLASLREPRAATAAHPPGENGLPSEAGMLALIQAALREISTSTRIVAR